MPRSTLALFLFDCQKGQWSTISKFPYPLPREVETDEAPVSLLEPRDGQIGIAHHKTDTYLWVDGDWGDEEPTTYEIVLARYHSILVGDKAYILKADADRRPQPPENPDLPLQWGLFGAEREVLAEPAELDQLTSLIARKKYPLETVSVLPDIFPVEEFEPFPCAALFLPQASQSENEETAGDDPEVKFAQRRKKAEKILQHGVNAIFDRNPNDKICPSCWLPFNESTVMAIASHEDLTDPVMGDNARLRFYPTRYTPEGLPIDSTGVPASGLACPHCRSKIPRDFLEIPHHIFSIVGASQSGKSYYFTVLSKLLQKTLFKKYEISFRDEDPQANAVLHEMRNKLFQGLTPEETFLLKTQLEGEMYTRLRRFGQEVSLPRPFSFILSKEKEEEKNEGLIFYDNAGEHFQPNVPLEDSPGALHVAVSAAILFIYDPTPNHDLRKKLEDHEDPQLKSPAPDNQEVIMAEMENRIKQILQLRSHQKINKPLAVIVNKCDIWQSLLPRDKLLPSLTDEGLNDEAIKKNSHVIREFLMEYEPALVANAEALSSQVRYFAVSSFGHSPNEFKDPESDAVYLAPDPDKLAPIEVETPVLWSLHQIHSQLFPSLP
ncbi:MAG: hypothetical protein JJT75_13655 [Opitutales bacterium]|nr:hypothetical protein [Opitutales bacterium]MCH8540487.1 hypothetical protein [Opitutales bacterium]